MRRAWRGAWLSRGAHPSDVSALGCKSQRKLRLSERGGLAFHQIFTTPDGNPQKLPGWEPTRNGHPRAFCRRSEMASRSATLQRGRDRLSLLRRYRPRKRCVSLESRLGKGWGLAPKAPRHHCPSALTVLTSAMNISWRISSLASASGNGIRSEMPNSLSRSRMDDDISRPFAPLRRSLR
jgi:hypothetical protein